MTTPHHLEHYLCNKWVPSIKLAKDSTALLHAVHGNAVARLNEDLVDIESAMHFARTVGNVNPKARGSLRSAHRRELHTVLNVPERAHLEDGTSGFGKMGLDERPAKRRCLR